LHTGHVEIRPSCGRPSANAHAPASTLGHRPLVAAPATRVCFRGETRWARRFVLGPLARPACERERIRRFESRAVTSPRRSMRRLRRGLAAPRPRRRSLRRRGARRLAVLACPGGTSGGRTSESRIDASRPARPGVMHAAAKPWAARRGR
jgi:hypothetical protein